MGPAGTRNGSNRFARAGTAQGNPLLHLKPRCRRVPDEFAIRAKTIRCRPMPPAPSSDPRQPRAGPDPVRHRGLCATVVAHIRLTPKKDYEQVAATMGKDGGATRDVATSGDDRADLRQPAD